MSAKQQIICPSDSRFRIELDASEIFPDDPGNGTPAMLYGPKGASSTFHTAMDNGEMMLRDLYVEIPLSVQQWLESVEDQVDDFIANNAPATASQ